MSSSTDGRQATMDSTQLYLEETFTDRKVGTIRRLTPVAADGSPDAARPVLFFRCRAMVPQGGDPPAECFWFFRKQPAGEARGGRDMCGLARGDDGRKP